MKTLEIFGDNYFGKWDKTRTACRGLVIKDDEILISYETKTKQYMIPGGGLEDETLEECCKREIEEETGLIVKPLECVLEIDEYYDDFKWVNKYFICEYVSEGVKHLTDKEIEVGMEPRWIKINEIIDIFSKHNDYRDIDEMRRGMYLREYTALTEIIKNYTF